MRHTILMLLFSCSAALSFAQNASDALRYAYLQPGGTARSIGAGGAFGALGAEFGAISQNPAGLALFRSNELSLTPSIRFSNTRSGFSPSSSLEDDKSKFGFDNIGLVFNTTPTGSSWKTFNFGIGYNRQADFNQAIYYEGFANGSIMNKFFNDYRTGVSDPFGVDLAVAANAVYEDNGVPSYDFAGNENASVRRTHSIIRSGRMNEMAVSFAGNYQEKLMVGATVGVPFVSYRIEGEYREDDPGDDVNFFDYLAYNEYLRSSGIGINLKLGMTYKVSQALRLGAAFHTPTSLSLTDAYNNSFTYGYTDGGGARAFTADSPDGNSDYKLRSPWRASASAAIVIKKMGFLSADVEWVDYAASRFNFTSDIASADNQRYEREVNTAIQRNYQQAMNVRLGGEIVLDEFRLRGGYNLFGKPQDGATGFNSALSAGAGIRGESFFLDLAWRHGRGTGSVLAYAGAPVADSKFKTNDFLLTLGFKF
jgi:long-subunit fatty acid transport protein